MKALRVLVADDHDAVRKGIRDLVTAQVGWIVCCEATSGREAVDAVQRLSPDLALLDIRMHDVSGLEATRQILARSPRTRVLLTTNDFTPEIAEEGRLAGAVAVVAKADADMLISALRSLSADGLPIHLAGSVVAEIRHVGAFFHSGSDRDRVLAPFVEEGLVRGEAGLHIVRPAGVDAERLGRANGHLDVRSWNGTYLRDGRFDQDAMLALIQEILRGKASQGFSMTRLVAHMEWALDPVPGVEDIVEYESRLSSVLPQFDDVVTCTYDLSKFGGDVIIDLVRAHPAVVIGDSFQHNPFYSPPEELIPELRRRRG